MSRFFRCLILLAGWLMLSAQAAAAEEGLTAGLENPGYLDKPAWFKESFLDLPEDVAEATAAGKRLLLYFHQDGCPYCAKLLQDNFADRAIADSTRKHFDVLAINIWGDRPVTGLDGTESSEKQFSARMRVQFTPSLIFLDEQGRVAMRINGYFPPHKFKAALDYVASGHERDQKFAQYYAALTPVKASGKIQPEAFFLPEALKLGDNRQSSSRPLMVLFEQAQCTACDELHNQGLRNQALVTALSNLDVAQLDMRSGDMLQTPDGSTMPVRQWAQSLGIQYAPSMVFFDQKSKEVFRVEAYLKSFHLHAAIDYVATGAYIRQPSFQRFIQHRADTLHAAGFEVDLMQ